MTMKFFAQTASARQTGAIADKCFLKRENQRKNVVATAKIVVDAAKK